jgi:beta-glucanase (GH16 family)
MMDRVVAIATVLALWLLPSFGARATNSAPKAKPATYLFDDEFNGTHVDLSKWQPNWLGTNNPISEENNCYNKSQVAESGGYLRFQAVKKSCKGHPYTSGIVTTHNTFHFTTGRLETRVFLPATSSKKVANWPAIWTDGYGEWPSTGESDVVEGITGQACWAYHGPNVSDGNDGCPSGNFTGWHVYAETVTKTTTTYYYDGHAVGHSRNVAAPHYVVLNLAVPAKGPVKIPGSMLVDYVRVRPL